MIFRFMRSLLPGVSREQEGLVPCDPPSSYSSLASVRVRANPNHRVYAKPNPKVEQEEDPQDASNNPSTLPANNNGGAVGNELRLSKVKIPTLVHSLNLSRIVGTLDQEIPGGVRCIATSPNQALIVMGSYMGAIALFEPITADGNNDTESNPFESPQPLFTYQGPKSPVTSLIFSANSSVLLAAWRSGKIIVFNVKDGSILREWDTPNMLNDCAFSNDGQRVVIGGDFGWKMFDFDKFPRNKIKQEDITSQERYVRSVNFSKDGTKLIVGSHLYTDGCFVYDGNGRELLATFCKGDMVFKAVLSPTNMILVVACYDKVCLFNIATRDCLHTFSIDGDCMDIEFSKDGQKIFFGDYGGKNIYGHDVYSGNRDFQCQLPQRTTSFLLRNDDSLLVPCEDENVYVINAAFEPTHRMQHEGRVFDSAVSRNGVLMAFGNWEGVRVFDTSNNKLLWEDSERALLVSFSPCGTKIACRDGDRRIHVYDTKDGSNMRTIKTPDFDWMEFMEDGNHILIFKKGDTTAHVIDIDTDATEDVITSAINLSACMIPQHNMLAFATEESIRLYSVNNDVCTLKDDLTFTLNDEKESGELREIVCTSDGSKMVLSFGTHLDIYNFDSTQGLNSSSMSSIPLPLQDGKAIADVTNIAISKDGKIVAFQASNRKDTIYTCTLEGEGDVERKVHTHSMGVDIQSINFLPPSSSSSHYPLVVYYANYGEGKYHTTTLAVDSEKGGEILDPSLLFRYFEHCNDETVNSLIPEHKDLLLLRNENGKTLAELAIETKRHAVLFQILDVVEPSFPWILLEVFQYLINTTDENRIEHCTTANKCAFPHIPPDVAERLVEMIPTLANNGFIDIICLLLQAGSPNCANGFVLGRQTYLAAFYNYPLSRWLGSLLLNRDKPCDGRQIIPECSHSPSGIEVLRGPEDKQKRTQVNAIRVCLPYLTSFPFLRSLVDIDLSSDEKGDGSNTIPQHLKPFECESLQASIEAAWYSWAQTRFTVRAVFYMVWMICIMSLEYVTIPALKAVIIGVICVGWVLLVRIEVQQLRSGVVRVDKVEEQLNTGVDEAEDQSMNGVHERKESKSATIVQYLYNFWNLWQISTLVLVLLFVIFNSIDMSHPPDEKSILFGQQWFIGLVHLFTLINFLYYGRGIERYSWILYALKVLTIKMYAFLVINLWILYSACSQLAKVNGAFDTKEPIHVFTETYITAVFGSFDSGSEYDPASTVVLVLFILLSLIFMIFMNAMIAFIGEEFANILNYKKAILAFEKACIIVDLYCAMSEEERKRIEEECKWVYKLIKQTDLNKIESSHTDTNADGRRATKQDIQSVTSQFLTLKKRNDEVKASLERVEEENGEVKASLERVEKENGEMRKEFGEMRSTLKEMRSDNSEMKLTLEKLVSMLSK